MYVCALIFLAENNEYDILYEHFFIVSEYKPTVYLGNARFEFRLVNEE